MVNPSQVGEEDTKSGLLVLHDKEEEAVKSDQLPWAQVMYPVTAGGGNANSGTNTQSPPRDVCLWVLHGWT